MGYLQNIKSPEQYINMMRAMMHSMPKVERDEVCQEIRQHLEALAEDHQTAGHSSEAAMTLAIRQFGSPFKVASKIAQKSKVKRQQLLEFTQPRLARHKKWLTFISSALAGAVPILIVMNYHYLPLIIVAASIHGIVSGVLFHYTKRLDTLIAAPEEAQDSTDLSEAREVWKKKLPEIAEQLQQRKNFRQQVNLRITQWLGNWFLNKERRASSMSSTSRWKLAWLLFGLVYLVALILWPAEIHQMTFKDTLIFLYFSMKIQPVSCNVADKLLSPVKTTQI